MIYIVCFFISSIFFYASMKSYNKEQFKSAAFFAIIGIFIISFLAGARSLDIGTDVKVYVVYAFDRIKNYSSITQVFQNYRLEIGYELLIYLCTRFSKDIHLLHFITSVIIASGFYSFLKQFSKNNKYSVLYGMIIFMLMNFNTSLNIVRQFLAISIILFGVKYLFDKNYFKYLIFVFIAVSFHRSAIMGFIIFFLYLILNNKKQKKIRLFFSIILTCIGILFLDKITILLYNFGIVSSQYLNYFSGVGNSSAEMQVLTRLPVLLLGLILYKDLINNNIKNQLLFCFSIIDCILSCMAPVLGDASRFSLYFGVWQCAFIPEIVVAIKSKVRRKGRPIISCLMYIYLFSFWYYCIVIRNFGNTFPYISDLFKN